MKKLMTSTIIILPILLLAILLVSGAIMSLIAHIYVETVEFSAKDAIILVMDDEENPPTYDLSEEITILPIKATNRDLLYTSSDTDVVEVSEDGVLTAVFYGETYVTVTSKENKAATATRKIIITDKSVHSLKMNEYKEDLYQNETMQLSVNIFPEEAENKSIKWESSNDKILQVSSNGTVTAVGNGVAIVTATSIDNENATATATISCHAELKSLIFDNSLFTTSLTEAQFPKIQTNPEKCDVTFAYSSSNEDIASVDEHGKITFSKEGSVKITVTATDFNGKSVRGEKEFVSTNGYFGKPLFTTGEIEYKNCADNGYLPINLAENPNGSYRKINEIECFVDNEKTARVEAQNFIVYDESAQKFKIDGQLPAFNSFIEVVVHATVYDFATNSLTSSYEAVFRIVKNPTVTDIKVLSQGKELTTDSENLIDFANIGDQIELIYENPDNLVVEINGNAYVDITKEDNTITLTSKRVCESSKIYLKIGPKTYILNLNIKAKAETLQVSSGGKQIEADGSYQTLLDTLTFDVSANRDDGQQVSSQITYQINGTGDWQNVASSEFTIENLSNTISISVKCDDITISFNLEKIFLQDFGVSTSYTATNGGTQTLDNIESVTEENELSCILPSNVQNNITIKLAFEDDNLLGGLGTNDDFKKLFPVELNDAEGWSVDYNSSTNEIVVTFNGTEFNKTITLTHDGLNLSLQLVRVNIQSIEFTGYNSETDNYAGYQQVRVFAKHSYYNNKQVDYFTIPFKALSDLAGETKASPDTIAWTLTRYVGSKADKIFTTQRGKEVTYNGEKYNIEQNGSEYVLKKDGEIVSGNNGENKSGIIWIDVYSEADKGLARIYFGNFAGLSETDVQNDYFGNFDDKTNWAQPAQVVNDGSGREFKPSENAYSFLRVEAGDGAKGGKNCHFNFNILNDDALVNIVDATGYLDAGKNVVLHNNLYGDGELDGDLAEKAKENGLILNPTVKSQNDAKMTKTIIYGNGNQVNLKVLNDAITESMIQKNKKNTSYSTPFGSLYNVTIKGCNPIEKIDTFNVKIYLSIERAYYCDLQYYSRMSKGGTIYLKNTVCRNVAEVALLLWRAQSNPNSAGSTAYVENLVIVNSITGIGFENGAHTIKIKGTFDLLNYQNKQGFANLFGDGGDGIINVELISGTGITGYDAILGEARDVIEWHGNENKNKEDFCANVAFYMTNKSTKSDAVSVWNEKQNAYVVSEDSVLMSNGTVLQEVKPTGMILQQTMESFGLHLWTYGSFNSIDGGEVIVDETFQPVIYTIKGTSRDMSKLFTDQRYIRLLCEYKNNGEKNDDHILWHMQQVYRDISLIKEREADHIKHLKSTLIGQNITWPDDTKPEDALAQTQAISNSTITLPPKKRKLAV